MRLIKGTPVKNLKNLLDLITLNLKMDYKVVEDVVNFKLGLCKKLIADPTALLPHIGIQFSTLGAFRAELFDVNAYIRNILLPHLRMAKLHKSSKYEQDCETFRRIWILRQYLIKHSVSIKPYKKYRTTAINEKLK